MDLIRIALQQMNITFENVLTQKDFEIDERDEIINLVMGMYGKEIYIALGAVGRHYLLIPYFDSTNIYYLMTVRWYVPCSVKYPRWSSIFRILSEELWLVLIISSVFAAMSITVVGRYICTSECQG
jgi:hypothetical protein